MPPTEHNPSGYFESQTISDLHDELLRDAGTSWDDVSSFPNEWLDSPSAAQWRKRMCDAFGDEFGTHPLLVLKDPRICRLVPFWLSVLSDLNVAPHFVLIVRSPLEVAASLARSQQTDFFQALLLWLQHTLEAERETRGYSRSFVSYEALLRDWRGMIARIQQDLGFAFPRSGQPADAETDSFVTSGLRHHSVSTDELLGRKDVPDWVKATFEQIVHACDGKPLSTSVLDEVRAQYRAGDNVFGRLLASSRLAGKRVFEDYKGLRAELQRVREQMSGKDQSLSALDARVLDLQSKLTARNAEFDQQRTQLETRDAQIDQLLGAIELVLRWSARMALGPDAKLEPIESMCDELKSADIDSIPQIAKASLDLTEQYARADRLELECGLLRVEVNGLTSELDTLRTQFGSQTDQLALELARNATLDEDHRRASVELARLREKFSALQEELETRAHAAERSASEFAQLHENFMLSEKQRAEYRGEAMRRASKIQGLTAELAVKASQLHGLESELRIARAELADRDLFIHRLSQQLSELQASTAWKLTKPVRSLAKILNSANRG